LHRSRIERSLFRHNQSPITTFRFACAHLPSDSISLASEWRERAPLLNAIQRGVEANSRLVDKRRRTPLAARERSPTRTSLANKARAMNKNADEINRG